MVDAAADSRSLSPARGEGWGEGRWRYFGSGAPCQSIS